MQAYKSSYATGGATMKAFILNWASKQLKEGITGSTKVIGLDRMYEINPFAHGRYVVSVKRIAEFTLDTKQLHWVNEELNWNSCRLVGTAIGTWANQKSGLFEVDLVALFNNRETALKAAVLAAQDYIFDLQEGTEIAVKDFQTLTTLITNRNKLKVRLEALANEWAAETNSITKKNINELYKTYQNTLKSMNRRITLLAQAIGVEIQ